MTTYTFRPKANSSEAQNWNDSNVWSGDVVPNGADADVVIPVVTVVSTGQPYDYTVQIASGESESVHSVDLAARLSIAGALSIAGTLTQEAAGSVDLVSGTLSADTIINNAYGSGGSGTINVGTLANEMSILGENLTLNVGSFETVGTLAASQGSLVVNVAAGGLPGIASRTFEGGTLRSFHGGTLALNAGGVIATDAGTISLEGGTITSHNPVNGRDVPLTTSLRTVAATGTLVFDGRDSSASYTFGSLDVAGSLVIVEGQETFGALSVEGSLSLGSPTDTPATLTASSLTLATNGLLQGSGTVTAPIVNNGTILAQYNDQYNFQEPVNISLQESVSGTGLLEIGAPYLRHEGLGAPAVFPTTIELGGAASGTVQFDTQFGVLQLNSPANFTAAIRGPTTAEINAYRSDVDHQSQDTILLKTIPYDQIVDVSYVGDTQSGTLTLTETTGSIALHFLGNYTLADFQVSAGGQVLSSDPAYTQIIFGPSHIDSKGAAAHDVDGDGTADIIWRSASGAVTDWLSQGDGSALDSQPNRQVASDWHIVGSADFDGDGRVDLLWRNDAGQTTDWLAGGSSFNDNDVANRQVATDWHVAGTGDFDGDGRADVLWRSDTGSFTDWLSTGLAFADNSNATRQVGTDWHIVGTGDFNGDNKSDVLWRNDNGAVTAWFSNGLRFVDGNETRSAAVDWHVAGTGDFNGDGKTDILWRNDDGTVTTWLSTGLTFVDNSASTRQAAIDWHIQGTGDYNGDGKTDVLWRSDAGVVTEWLSTGTGFIDDPHLSRQVAADWSIFGG